MYKKAAVGVGLNLLGRRSGRPSNVRSSDKFISYLEVRGGCMVIDEYRDKSA